MVRRVVGRVKAFDEDETCTKETEVVKVKESISEKEKKDRQMKCQIQGRRIEQTASKMREVERKEDKNR